MKRNLSRILSLMIAVCLVSVLPSAVVADPDRKAYPDDSVFVGEEFNYILADGQATIVAYTGRGFEEELVIPEQLDGYPVVGIDDWTFTERDGLISLTIPESVTFIGDRVFDGMYGLMLYVHKYSFAADYANERMLLYEYIRRESKSYASGDYTYELVDGQAVITGYTGSGADLVIPDELNGYPVTVIDDNAFSECAGITGLTIPQSVKILGDCAFASTGLTSVTIPGTVAIVDGSFYHCDELTSVVIEEGVGRIGSGTFAWCGKLTRATIPASVTRIEDIAFHKCDDLTLTVIAGSYGEQYARDNRIRYTVDIMSALSSGDASFIYELEGDGAIITGCTMDPAGDLVIPGEVDGYAVTGIGEEAFWWCAGLTSVTIPEGVTFIGEGAFDTCTGLTSAIIPNGVLSIGASAFDSCTALASVTIPESVTSIGESAFDACASLTGVNIPEGVTAIEAWAFYECSSLTSVTIPESVTSIGESAFQGCEGLVSIAVPDSVVFIGDDAFLNCYELILTAAEGSYAAQYAAENGIRYKGD